MTVRKGGSTPKHPRKVRVAEVYWSISEVLRAAWVDGTESSGIAMTPAPCEVGVSGIAVVRVSAQMTPAPQFQMSGLEIISVTRHDGRGPDGSLVSSRVPRTLFIQPYG